MNIGLSGEERVLETLIRKDLIQDVSDIYKLEEKKRI